MNLEIHPQARHDIAGAAEYYRCQVDGLDREFLAELDAAMELVASDPFRFERVRRGIRRCLVRRFPYGVYYRVRGKDQVVVIVVRHHSRHPSYGMSR
jgi:toxin ParE1/3/4